MCESNKGWLGKVEDKYTTAIVHITKVETFKSKGMYSYFFPPRIGIDFYLSSDYPEGNHDFIPNLELGDVARLINILGFVERDQTFDSLSSGTIKPFEIGLAFETDLRRKVTIGAEYDYLTIKYEGLHRGKEVSIEYQFTRKGIEEFIKILKELTIEYINFIQRYILIGKIDPKFK
jgi:hypothetical protein